MKNKLTVTAFLVLAMLCSCTTTLKGENNIDNTVSESNALIAENIEDVNELPLINENEPEGFVFEDEGIVPLENIKMVPVDKSIKPVVNLSTIGAIDTKNSSNPALDLEEGRILTPNLATSTSKEEEAVDILKEYEKFLSDTKNIEYKTPEIIENPVFKEDEKKQEVLNETQTALQTVESEENLQKYAELEERFDSEHNKELQESITKIEETENNFSRFTNSVEPKTLLVFAAMFIVLVVTIFIGLKIVLKSKNLYKYKRRF